MHRFRTALFLCSISLPVAAQDSVPVRSGVSPEIANALIAGTIYSYAVIKNANGFCLPAKDGALDVIWKVVSETPSELKDDVVVEPNRLPETAFQKLLSRLFPCR